MGVLFQHLTAILEFMYAGEVNVAQDQLPQFLKTAERLKVAQLDSQLFSLIVIFKGERIGRGTPVCQEWVKVVSRKAGSRSSCNMSIRLYVLHLFVPPVTLRHYTAMVVYFCIMLLNISTLYNHIQLPGVYLIHNLKIFPIFCWKIIIA